MSRFQDGRKDETTRIFGGYKIRFLEGEDLALRQLVLANQYRNALVKCERRRRYRHREYLQSHCPEYLASMETLDAANEEVEAAKGDIARSNSLARRKGPGTPEQAARLRAAKARRRECAAAFKAAKARAYADPDLSAALADYDTLASQEAKALRAEFSQERGLYWGTYLRVEDACRSFRKGTPPRYREFRGEPPEAHATGQLAVQIQKTKPLTAADMSACDDTRLRLRSGAPGGADRGLPAADPESAKSRNKPWVEAWFRIGSEGPGGRIPVWAKLRFRMFRPLPPEGQIKWAYLLRRRTGNRFAWELQFVVDLPGHGDGQDQAFEGRCGIDLNWRLLGDGLRVATLAGPDKHQPEHLSVPSRLVAAWHFVDDLSSRIDNHFNEAKETLATWLDSHPGCPEWLREQTQRLRAWKSPHRLAAVVVRWRSERFEGDEEIYAKVAEWRSQSVHLHEYKERTRKKAERHRNDIYRKFARSVASRYADVFMEDTNWQEIRRKSRPGDEDAGLPGAAKRHADVASPGLLRRYLSEAVSRLHLVPARNTSRMCHNCGCVNCDADLSRLHFICDGCGAVWDQDVNAALNLCYGDARAEVVA